LIREDELQVARDKRGYRAGIWAFRAALTILAIQVVLMLAGAIHGYFGPVGTWFVLAYVAAVIAGYALLDRAGVRVFGLSDGVWSRRKMVYQDVFGLGRRRPSGRG
jgi:hypothetical protein